MGTARNQDLLHGAVVHDATVTPAAITEKDDSTVLLRSAYTQASPRAGLAQPGAAGYQMAVKASGTPDEDASIELLTQKGGHPIPEDGGCVWRNLKDADAKTEYKGVDSYVSVTDFDELFYTTDAVNTPAINVLRLQNGDMLATGVEITAGGVRVFYYTTSTGSWTTVGPYNPGVEEQSHTQYAMSQLPSGRVLLFWQTADKRQIDVKYSDDNGATWANYAQRILSETMDDGSGALISPTRLQVSYSNGTMMLLYAFTDASTNLNLAQYASSDEGHTFTLVRNDFHNATSYPALEPSIVAVPSGGFVIGALANVTGAGIYRARFYRVGSAFTPIDEGDATNIWAADDNPNPLSLGLTAWLDEDDILYVIVLDADFVDPNVSNNIRLYRSRDFGATVTAYNAPDFNFGNLTQYIHSYDCASTGGKAILCTRWTDAGGTSLDETSVAAIGLGGFSTHTLPDSDYNTSEQYQEINALAFGPDDAPNPTDAGFYSAMTLPDVIGWTRVTAGGAARSVTTNAELSLTTAGGGDTEYYYRSHTGAIGAVMAQFCVRVPIDQGDKTTNEIVARFKLGDNSTYGFDISIRLEDDGYNVYDEEAAANIGSAVSYDLTSRRWFRVLLSKDSKTVRVWSSPDGHVKRYVLDKEGTGLTDRAGAGYVNFMYFGNFAAGSNNSLWRNASYSMLPNKWSPGDLRLGGGWTNPTALRPKSYSSRRTLIDDGIFAAAEGGPTTLGETFQIDADYEFALANIHPGTNPSPGKTWRSTGVGSDVHIVWNTESLYTDDGITDNNIIAIYLLNANFKDALFQVWTGAAWTTLATLDASSGYSDGATGLKFERHGRKIIPDTTETTQGERYLFYEDHVGDTFDLGAEGGGQEPPGQQYAKIVHNTEGAWVGSGSTTKRPVLILDSADLDGGEVTKGTGAIWRTNFGAVIAGFTDTYSKYRLRIPAQSTADEYFELGEVIFGPVAIFGKQYDRGYAFTHLHPQTVETLPNGAQRVRKDGPEQRRFTYALSTGAVDLTTCNVLDPNPDYRTAEAKETLAVATMHDTTRTIEGLIRRTHAAETPMLLLTAIPRSTTGGSGITTTLMTQRRGAIWARTQTDPFVEAILGDELDSELERYQLITAEEVV